MYGLKAIFKYVVSDEVFYEESIIKLCADSVDEAFTKARKYAEERVSDEHINPNNDKVYKSVVDIVDCFYIYEDEDIQEVYSRIKKKPESLDEKLYLEILGDGCSAEKMQSLRYK